MRSVWGNDHEDVNFGNGAGGFEYVHSSQPKRVAVWEGSQVVPQRFRLHLPRTRNFRTRLTKFGKKMKEKVGGYEFLEKRKRRKTTEP